ncbi:poly-gamma-glutamate synthesis protein (capsule biosynthesis protein) [Kineothrix alysoides]|uniref:Poly-gamma-glutamate synthesis protein (Capsule biosynthesis protein) n=1 Tax=Kineothrix alysoides TaxID=1469948 RepID=A0A4R1QYP0_9FIRM|nr:CapA family protein [Kineothrix alysoides]TCL58082.1 poly-gamma-glutamate synthesis protein (capsule biosynthesis protein) [Kineothrix alysoides]
MKKTRRRKIHFLNILLTFWLTFAGVVIVGVAGILIYNSVVGKADAVALSPSGLSEVVSHMFSEKIPEEEAEAREEALNISGRYGEILSDKEYMALNNIYAKEAASAEEVTLSFGGDILFDPSYSVMVKLLQRKNGIYDSISAKLLEEMKSADILMLNNEFPYSDRGTPTPEKQFTFRARPESVSLLDDMGVDIVSLANNHAYDYGEAALLDSLDILKEAGMPYVGAGRNLEEAAKPVYFIINDIKIAYLSATQIERLDNPDTKGATDNSAGVFRCWNPEGLLEAVKAAKENSDFVVVYIHWGTENTEQLDWAQLDQAPKIVEAGADLIIGDHPHCLQPIQYVDGVPVVYSLGNFWFNSKQVDTCLVKAAINENGLKSLKFIPALQKDCQTSLLEGAEKERVLSYMRAISPGVNIDEEGYIN